MIVCTAEILLLIDDIKYVSHITEIAVKLDWNYIFV